jgi:uncharacterized protein (TIGR00730 family)
MEDTTMPKNSTDKRLFRPKKLTTDDIRAGCIKLHRTNGVETEICVADEELRQGIDIMNNFEKSITIFGSARTPISDFYYEKARTIAYRSVKECGCAVVTGGGPGIMEAGNRGAHDAGGKSIGMQIVLPHEQVTNPYLTDMVPFYFFYTRETAMRYAGEVFLFFPGGFGTWDELFECLTLIQTDKIPNVPVVLVGSEYWNGMDAFIRKEMLTRRMVTEQELSAYVILDDNDQIIEVIKNAPKRTDK